MKTGLDYDSVRVFLMSLLFLFSWKNTNAFQRSSHFPGGQQLGRKDLMYRNVSKLKRSFPKEYNFIPKTYLMHEYAQFKLDKANAKKKQLWIGKPNCGAQGKGIIIIDKNRKLRKRTGYIISEYIDKPHLIDGYKYDLRVYAIVTCFEPLRIYVYPEGLTRICTEKYSSK